MEWLARWAALGREDRRIVLLRAGGILVWVLIPLLLFLHPQNGLSPFVQWPGARIVWTVVVALLPLAIVIMGFYTWRQVCPLMMFSRMSEWIGWPDRKSTVSRERRRRFASPTLARIYPVVTWSFLFVMLALRLVLINSNAVCLALAFIGLTMLAMLTGFVYTGKTWCNFICPVGTIEKIYTDGDRPQYRQNSQCSPCTRCKTQLTRGLCPDINQEKDYWQELRGHARSFAYYSFPGLVLGFYTWYFLHAPDYWNQAGGPVAPGFETRGQDGVYDWGYYLSGDWTRDPAPWKHLMDPGFGFAGAPYIPTVIAAPLTLAVFSAASLLIFVLIEKIWRAVLERQGLSAEKARDSARHPLFAWAGFAAFNLFYAFAGAPTFRQLPFGLYGLFRFGVVVFSSLVLYTRLRRTRVKLWQFDQARKWIANWPWKEPPAPLNLEDAYTVYTVQAQLHDSHFQVYKDAVRSTMAEHLLTAAEIEMLDRLALEMGIEPADQQRILREIGKEFPELIDPAKAAAPGDQLRLIGYRGELERLMAGQPGHLLSELSLQDLQTRYRIEPPDHEAVLNELLNPSGVRAQQMLREADGIREMQDNIVVLDAHPGLSTGFLAHEVQGIVREDREHLLDAASLYGPARDLASIRAAVLHSDRAACEEAAIWMRTYLPEQTADPVIATFCTPVNPADPDTSPAALARVLLHWSHYPQPYPSAAAVHAMATVLGIGGVEARAREALQDVTPLLREAAIAALSRQLSSEEWEAVLLDPEMAVREAALYRLPVPVPREIASLVERAAEDGSPRVRAAAGIALASPGAIARQPLPPGADLPGIKSSRLSSLERLFSLRLAPLLAHVPAAQLHELAWRADELALEAGSILCSEGELSDTVYILVEGEAEAVQNRNGTEVVLGRIYAGECVGELAALDPGPRTATVRVRSPVLRALTISGEDFRDLVSRDPKTALGVIRLVTGRQRRSLI